VLEILQATAPELPPVSRLLRRIAGCTSRNDHTGALQLAAKSFGLNDEHEKLTSIVADQDRRGYLSDAGAHERRQIYIRIMAHAKQHLGEAAYRQFYAAF
jgi:hypothetical protein